jgi:2-succinyl-5-enolpyruvyl-6-hydroxy-3-cyclohexene-1-carboxylate synthase
MTAVLVGEWSRLLATSFVQAGLRHAVICPGSRSTPFAWALAATPGLSCHSLIDERAAAFFALGLGRTSGEAALVLSTSGSAAANFFPAVVEAALARVPLLVLTADRPLELQAAGAAQTIDQVKLYGNHVRGFFDLGTPDAHPSTLAGVQRLALQALATTRLPEPGPVHVNARARKPLEPAAATTPEHRALVSVVDTLLARGVTRVTSPRAAPEQESLRALAKELNAARRALVICGPLPPREQPAGRALLALAQRLALPVFAEGTSGLRYGAEGARGAEALDWLLRSPSCRAALAPDCILRVGAVPTMGGLEPLLAEHPGAALHVIAEHGHPDALGRARSLTHAPLALVSTALGELSSEHTPSGEQRAFAASLSKASHAAWEAVRAVTAQDPELGELDAVRLAVESVPDGGLLVVGNSLPVRLIDAFEPRRARGFSVASQRGANGIDGLVAGAAGSALDFGKPALLLLGDVSLEHDLGGLAAARLVRTPLALVVIDNGGGRIFEQLPVAKLWESEPKHAELWLTPPRLAFEHAASLFGLRYAAPADASSLSTELAQALSQPGATLVHLRVPPHSARDTLRAATAEVERQALPLLRG